MSNQAMWTMKNGEKIPVVDMTEEHARNTIQMLLRKNNPNVLLYTILKGREAIDAQVKAIEKKKEIFPHGDMAQQFNEVSSRELHESSQFEEISWEDPLWP
jgi:hypothetical protein